MSGVRRAEVAEFVPEKDNDITNQPPMKLRPTTPSPVATRKIDRSRFRGPMRGHVLKTPITLPRMGKSLMQRAPLQERLIDAAQATPAERGRARRREMNNSIHRNRPGGSSVQGTGAPERPSLPVPIAQATAQAETEAEAQGKRDSLAIGVGGDTAESPVLLDSDGDDLYGS